MSKRILLTGGNGFVGRQVLKYLLKIDVIVRLVLREGCKLPLELMVGVENVIMTKDLFAEDVSWWAGSCRGVDTIIHCAWYVEHEQYLLSSKNLDCLAGTLNLVKGALQSSVRRITGVGTCFEYDLSHGLLAVDTPLKPLTPYAAAKAAAYMLLSQWCPTQKIEFSWCRLFYLYGQGEDPRRLVPHLHSKLAANEPVELTSGNQVRDFMDVAQAAKRIVRVALSNIQGPVNICSGKPITIRELAEKIADEYGRRDLLRFGARPDNYVDPPTVVGIRTEIKR